MFNFYTLTAAFIFLPILAFAAPASESCDSIKASLGESWGYDTVTVPLDWNKPSKSSTIDIYYYFRKAAAVKDKTPIVFMNGGPTVAGARAAKMFDSIPALQDQNLILIDQRGTGCSVGFPIYSPEMDMTQYQKFSSDSIVRDAEAIRQKMFGQAKWKVYGQSYGGLISFRYLEMFPKSIYSAHIHGYGFWQRPKEILDMREKKLLEVSNEFFKFTNIKLSPQTAGEIIQNILLSESLPAGQSFAKMCIKTPGARKSEFCGYDLITGLFLTIGFKNFWPFVHETVFKIDDYIQKNNLEALEKLFVQFSENYILRFNEPNQAAALQAITYNELIPGHQFTDGCTPGIRNPIISECYIDENFLMLVSLGNMIPNPIKLSTVRRNIKRFNVPIYYYGGAFDSFIPPEMIRWTAEQLDIKNQLVIFDNSGHEGYYTESLLLKTLVEK